MFKLQFDKTFPLRIRLKSLNVNDVLICYCFSIESVRLVHHDMITLERRYLEEKQCWKPDVDISLCTGTQEAGLWIQSHREMRIRNLIVLSANEGAGRKCFRSCICVCVYRGHMWPLPMMLPMMCWTSSYKDPRQPQTWSNLLNWYLTVHDKRAVRIILECFLVSCLSSVSVNVS